MKSRLKKNNQMTKMANIMIMPLDSIILRSGDAITFSIRIVNNKPWFQIVQESAYTDSSYYDGNDFEKAFDMYLEILIAFKGVMKAEQIRKSKSYFETKVKQMEESYKKVKQNDMYDALKRNPLFLGMNDF